MPDTKNKPAMEEIVVKAKRPSKKTIRENKRQDRINTGIKIAGAAINPSGFLRNSIVNVLKENYKQKKQDTGPFERDQEEDYDPNRFGYQEGGETVEDQMGDLMMMPEEEMVPTETPMESDEEMENNYIDFIVGESLTPEDEEYLLTALEQDNRLSMIFDRVVETASEFAGSGPVEGPGTGMSDSIPARLSDGEFVITSKATEEIGPDKLQGMMEQAEMDADNRQMRQAGGYVTETEEEQEEQEIVRAVQPKETQGRVMPRSLADKKVNESMIALNPRNSLFAT